MIENNMLLEYLRSQRPIIAAIVFGSAAADRLRPESDFDLALLFAPAHVPDDEAMLSMRTDLEEIVARNVDFIVLNRASTILAFQIIKTGVVIFCRDRRSLEQFIVRLITEYADFKIIRRPIEEAVIKRRVL